MNSRAMQLSRQAQVQTLLKKFPETKTTADANVFILNPPQLRGEIVMVLRLPMNFPTGRPELRLIDGLKVAEWKYSDIRGNICHSKLQNWGINCVLGPTIEQIVLDMKRSFPKILTFPQTTQNIPKALNPPRSGMPRFEPKTEEFHIPPVPDTFEEVSKKNEQELMILLNNPDQLELFISKLPYKETISQLVEDIENQNLIMAKKKVEKDEELRKDVEQLNAKKKELENLQNRYSELKEEQKKIKERYAPVALMKILNEAVNKVENESEELAEKFIQDGGDISSFLKEYRTQRELYHLRRQKQIKFQQKFVNGSNQEIKF